MKKALGFGAAMLVCLLLVECLLQAGDVPGAAASGTEHPEVPAVAPTPAPDVEKADALSPDADAAPTPAPEGAPKAAPRPPFDADAVAAAEIRMWKAYYDRNQRQLGLELVTLFQRQFGVERLPAAGIAMSFAEGAMTFQKGDYQAALPPLERAYGEIRRRSGMTFDPAAAARAELAWWVARRTRGQDSNENVGRLITELYVVLYGRTNAHLVNAGRLRAEAARLRDLTSDWPKVEELLRDSYRELAAGVAE